MVIILFMIFLFLIGLNGMDVWCGTDTVVIMRMVIFITHTFMQLSCVYTLHLSPLVRVVSC
jgi:hypothetical protein